MGITVTSKDLDRSHRQFSSSRKGTHRRPPILLVKFVSHDLRDLIYSNRNILRNIPGYRNIYVNENLTKVRRNLFREIRKVKDFDSWTYDGKIYMRHIDYPNVRHVVTTRSDIKAILP